MAYPQPGGYLWPYPQSLTALSAFYCCDKIPEVHLEGGDLFRLTVSKVLVHGLEASLLWAYGEGEYHTNIQQFENPVHLVIAKEKEAKSIFLF